MHEFGASNETLFREIFDRSHLYWYLGGATAPAPSRRTRVRGRPSALATLRIGRVGPGATGTHLFRKAALAKWALGFMLLVGGWRKCSGGSHKPVGPHQAPVSHGVASIATIGRTTGLVVVLYHMRVGHEMPVGPYDEWLE